jgi:hypothetical protein
VPLLSSQFQKFDSEDRWRLTVLLASPEVVSRFETYSPALTRAQSSNGGELACPFDVAFDGRAVLDLRLLRVRALSDPRLDTDPSGPSPAP